MTTTVHAADDPPDAEAEDTPPVAEEAPPAAVPPQGTVDGLTARARLSPREYKRSRYFAEDHPSFSMRAAFGVVLVLLCSVFSLPWTLARHPPEFGPLSFDTVLEVVHFVAAWGALPIFLLAFRAIGHARAALGDFGVNTALARHVERSASARVAAIRLNPELRRAVSTLQSDHLPDNPADPKPAAYRLFQRICAEAQDRRFESTINLVEPYHRESMEGVLRLESVQKTALRLGILCHFIGLVLVINTVPSILGAASVDAAQPAAQAIATADAPAEAPASSPQSARAIGAIVTGLQLAFGASVAGLAVSIFAGWLLNYVRQMQFGYLRKLDEATAVMISLATNSLNNDELLVSLTQMSRRLEDQTAVVKTGVLTVAEAIAGQARTIDEALRSLGDGKTKLDDFLKGVSSSHDEFLRNLKSYYDIGTISGIASQLRDDISRAQAESLAGVRAGISEEIRDIRGEIAGLSRPFNPAGDSWLATYLPHAVLSLLGAIVLILLLR